MICSASLNSSVGELSARYGEQDFGMHELFQRNPELLFFLLWLVTLLAGWFDYRVQAYCAAYCTWVFGWTLAVAGLSACIVGAGAPMIAAMSFSIGMYAQWVFIRHMRKRLGRMSGKKG
jgi:hypothetical protein